MIGVCIALAGVKHAPEIPNPIQMFASVSKVFERRLTERCKLGYRHYCHLSYYTNLSNPTHTLDKYAKEIEIVKKLGFLGCVVHVGKANKLPKDEATDLMHANVRKLIEMCTPECPLMIETPAGQGKELLSTIEEFASFCEPYVNEPRFCVCIDTCHVFATGYSPVDYLYQWQCRSKVRIGLIHLNDSLKPLNSHIDKHARVGFGYIGAETLQEVVDFGTQANIDMIQE